MYHLKLSRRMNVLKSSRAISPVNIKPKTNVPEISSVSIIKVKPDGGDQGNL
jgi:hypothetical protein